MELQDQIIALRKETKMGRREFAEYFGIPYRTLQDWELGRCRIIFTGSWHTRLKWKRSDRQRKKEKGQMGKFCVKKVHIAGLCRE